MRLLVATVGRLKDGPERALFEKYRERFDPLARRLGLAPAVWHEISESRARDTGKRRDEEGAGLSKLLHAADYVIALDERGRALTSDGFAAMLAKVRDGGAKCAGLTIGGPDGLSAEVLESAHLRISFGAVTLPHALARIILAEQLYRAATILAGHPYHRA
jgi:23S rRNA (pseudouridine1915-N3)-methyltransferase